MGEGEKRMRWDVFWANGRGAEMTRTNGDPVILFRRRCPRTNNNAESFLLDVFSTSLSVARAPRRAALRTKESTEYKSREDISQHLTGSG